MSPRAGVRLEMNIKRLLTLLITMTAGSATLLAAQDDRPGVGVFRFENGSPTMGDSDYTPFTVGLQQLFISRLVQNSELRLIDRNRLREVLDEISLGQTDRVDPRTALEVGRVVNAKYLVQGTFVIVGEMAVLTAITTNVETTEQIAAVDVTGDAGEILGLVVELAGKVTDEADLPALPEFRESMEAEPDRAIPEEAVRRYSHALIEQDLGRVVEARALLLTLTEEHPEWQDARDALDGLPSGDTQ